MAYEIYVALTVGTWAKAKGLRHGGTPQVGDAIEFVLDGEPIKATVFTVGRLRSKESGTTENVDDVVTREL